ncbi:MAG TPA: Panacea domain-containing protein [Candidatus Absconditabacterales bacterium]|nr:Panacea domain-containing protein [Candidatus Absconditabacterales bacterium]HMT27342.1 Panacea domain-containing protein [Candidatus Absconditabacterales bacterium]
MFSNNEKLIIYVIANRLGCSITEIMKLCYLIDLGGLKKLHKQITDFSYIRYTYGPFDQKIYDQVNVLVKKGILKYVCYAIPSGDEVCKYELQDNFAMDFNFPNEEKTFIDEMLNSLSSFNAFELTKLAYQTKPMKDLGATLGGNQHIGDKLKLEVVMDE